MLGLSMPEMIGQLTDILAAAGVALWDAVAAEPKLQLMLLGCVALTLLKGELRGRTRRAR